MAINYTTGDPQVAGDTPDETAGREAQRGKLLDGLVPDVVRKVLQSGVGALFMTEEGIRHLVTELRLPKEAVGHLRDHAEHAKEQLYERLSTELRSFFESVSFKRELQRVLSSVVLEIRTEIRFVPAEDTLVAPKMSTTVRARRASRRKPSET